MQFQTTIHQEPEKDHAGIPVPPEVVEALGAGKRPLVVVTVGNHTYRSSIAIMAGRFVISLSAANRRAAGVAGGDVVTVDIEVDAQPREIEVPESLANALRSNEAAREAFGNLSNSRKKRITLPIEDAKSDETRERRVARAIEDLLTGKA